MKSQGWILIFWQLIHQFGLNFYPTSDKVDNSLSLVFGQFTFAMNGYGHNLSLNQFCSIWSVLWAWTNNEHVQNYWNMILFQISSNDFRILKQFKRFRSWLLFFYFCFDPFGWWSQWGVLVASHHYSLWRWQWDVVDEVNGEYW